MALHLKSEGIEFKREYAFCPGRRWRFDFVILKPFQFFLGLAIEVEGGVGGKSRHTSFTGMSNDNIKYSEAALLGWGVMRFTTDQVRRGVAIDFVKRAMAA